MPSSNVLRFPKADSASPQPAAPADAAARAQALDVTASFIVEAPAGSGKTGLLVQRYLKLLAHESTERPEEVVAITFTRKATAELRERILTQLSNAAAEAPVRDDFEALSRTFALAVLDRDAQHHWGLLTRPQRLHIRTIDSVCAEIASTLPLLSGAGSPRTPSDDPEPLYRLAAQRTLLQLGGSNHPLHDALWTVLLHRDGSLTDCESLLARMLAQREQWGELIPLGPSLDDAVLENEVRPSLERTLEQIVCAGLTRAVKTIPADMLHGLAWLAARLADEPGYKDEPSPIALCADKTLPPEDRAEHLEHWLALIGLLLTKDGQWRSGFNVNHIGFALTKQDKALLAQTIDEVRHDDRLRETLCAVRALPPARYPDEQWRVAKALFHLLNRALAELKVLFAERDECDFAELSIAAQQALRSDSGVADLTSAAGSAIRHLLVDEMQDTSSAQYALIELLTAHWDGHSQTVFLVGDPKQSIYLFRQARVERFLRAMREQRLGDIPLTALHLTANFRSQAALIDHFNRDFSLIFPSPDDLPSDPQALDVPFVAADTIRPASADAAGIAWHVEVLPDATPENPDPKRDQAESDARSIRDVITAWQVRELPKNRRATDDLPAKPWRIAILVRARDHFLPILREFQRPDAEGGTIPYRALEIERLNEQPEVLDALALTRALLHPADRVAWLAILHAPWCGLGLADLLALSGNGTPDSAEEILPEILTHRHDFLTPEGQRLLDRIAPILTAALGQRGRTSTAVWVERTWRSLGGDVALTPQQRGNVELFLSALRDVEEPGGRVSLPQLEAAVRDLYAQPRFFEAGEFCVDLLTMHGAKGLEWDVVLVPSLERRGAPSRSEFLNWLELDTSSANLARVVLAPIWGRGNDPDALHKWLSKVRADREAAERKRLFYVASTRAREELHLFAAASVNKAGDFCAPAGTLLQAAWPAALPHIVDPTVASTNESLRLSLEQTEEETATQPLALAAAAAEAPQANRPPILHRLPLSFHPAARFAAAAAVQLPYTPATDLRQAPGFDRPEGSFAVRAFGNVVHRYLQLLAAQMDAATPDSVLADLPQWLPRLTASLRSEGLPPAELKRSAQRALAALQRSLTDPVGRWILSPHPGSQSEQALRNAAAEVRVDRTFLAGPEPLSTGTHLWIVDFKTTEQGSRSDDAFDAQEREKYGAQLETYARTHLGLPHPPTAIVLGLYYPLVPRLISWPAPAKTEL